MKTKMIVVALALLTGCTAMPRPKSIPVDVSECRAVEGSQVKVSRDGKAAYKYNCGGEIVWSVLK